MRFVKMHGCGNDYVVIDGVTEPELADASRLRLLVRAMCDRRTGIGADGALVISQPADPAADLRVRVINPDGSDGGMCGNGLRCVAKYAHERSLVGPDVQRSLEVEMGGRQVSVRAHLSETGVVSGVTVDLGPARFEPESLPMDTGKVARSGDVWEIGGRAWLAVSMGNPHVVAMLDEPVAGVELESLGPEVERHPAFPHRVNVHIVNIHLRQEIEMRSWERGAGLTLACGSGACAACAAGQRSGVLDEHVRVRVPGGVLEVRRERKTGSMLLTGPAENVFEGEWHVPSSADATIAP